jgi:putative protein-disulfide isomerase
MPSLIYVADPMCSWCYGFGPELAALLDGLPGMPIEVVVGGLRPYTSEAMDDALKTRVRTHWGAVAERTGLPFVPDALERAGFVYDTEPACRAVVSARILAPRSALYVLHAIQRAFYSAGRDVTDADVLADVCSSAMTEAGTPTDRARFLSMWTSEKAIRATHDDFLQVQRWKINGFPTLLLERDGVLDMVTSGYVAMPDLIASMQALMDRDRPSGQPGA